MGIKPFDWLADRTGIHPSRVLHGIEHAGQQIGHGVVGAGHVVGNVLDNPWTKAAIAAGLMATGAGAPLGAAIMGGTGALGGALHEGGGLRDSLVGGAKGAGYGAAAGGAGQALRAAFAPGSVGGSAAAAAPGAGGSAGSSAAAALGDAAKSAAIEGAPGQAGGGNALLNALGNVGSFAAKNPTAVGQGLQGVGQAFDVDGSRGLARAQAQQIAMQTQAMQTEEEAKKRRAEAMLPLLRALMGNQSHGIAANPYA